MSHDCGECPRLRVEVMRLGRLNEFLRRQVGQLLGGVRSAITFIANEQEEPSMPVRQLPGALHLRLTYVAEQAEGKNV
ncbi:hypothetical protein [Actinoplanes friuliensis]|uniref:Uncharacterized protein n=1 Tax=Actinoplanes friuliensis DSM 7358 TaxID=1246995 RepID=U5VVF5_9ACTN|nr:hypothetical protein [Actinoplanes friuliensis]AGZ39601.1 hypothetical protein AFR_06560 [Actinoplanes friuliensis DSM 7358]